VKSCQRCQKSCKVKQAKFCSVECRQLAYAGVAFGEARFCKLCRGELVGLMARNQFCSRSCKNSYEHQQGIRRDYVNDKTTQEWWDQKEDGVERRENWLHKMSEVTSGEKNGMFGRQHTDETKKKIRVTQTGRTIEEIHGVDRARELRQLYSLQRRGKKNPAYGKVYPGVGRSKYQGWYKGIHFRSLWELSFLVEMFEKHETITSEPFSIKYTLNGRDRTYKPDFLIEDRLYEIKPKALLGHESVVPKLTAGQKFCEENCLRYVIVTEENLKILTLDQAKLLDVKWQKFQKKEEK